MLQVDLGVRIITFHRAQVHLAAGDLLIAKNCRALHGRSTYSPKYTDDDVRVPVQKPSSGAASDIPATHHHEHNFQPFCAQFVQVLNHLPSARSDGSKDSVHTALYK